MSILAVLFCIVLFIMVLGLRRRVEELERALKNRPAQASVVPAVSAQPMSAAQPIAQPTRVASAPQPPSENKFIAWLKENWLLKLGALLLLIGFGWLVTYAFLNNWIGPAGRITFGLGTGALILALGYWRIRTFVTQGAVFVALGATVVLLTTYAARSVYDFFTPLSALALMFATCALVALVSGVYNRKQLAIVSVALAAIAPILAHAPSHEYLLLFGYLLVVVVGSVWVAVWKGYREVVTVALIAVALHGVPYLLGIQDADMPALLLFAYAFAAIFYVTNAVGLLRLRDGNAVPDLITAAGSALLLLVWIHAAVLPEIESLMLAAWALAFVIGAFSIFRITGAKVVLYLYTAIAAAYIAAATAVELDGAALTIAYSIESVAIALALYLSTRDVAAGQRASILMVGPVFLSLSSMAARGWNYGVFNEHFFVLLVVSLAFFALGWTFWAPSRTSASHDVVRTTYALLILGSVYAYILVWLSAKAALPGKPDIAVMIALSIYTVVGIIGYIEGVKRGRKGVQAYGGVLLAAVVARLLVVDVWHMALTGRIITFFLIGTLLMSTAFLGRAKKHADVSPPNHV